MDTTSGFHDYRLEMQNEDLRVYVDGEMALDAKGKFKAQQAYRNKIAFGAASSTELGAAYWDSVKVRTVNAGQALWDVVVSVKYKWPAQVRQAFKDKFLSLCRSRSQGGLSDVAIPSLVVISLTGQLEHFESSSHHAGMGQVLELA